jgi:hypothetical protein
VVNEVTVAIDDDFLKSDDVDEKGDQPPGVFRA